MLGMTIKKIGLYGGTFDPVHDMHIDIAEKTLEQLGLDEVWFLADKQPRTKLSAIDYKHRLEMLRLASQHNDKLIADILPIQKQGATHGIKTLKQFIREYPGHEFVIISGIDSILFLDQWEDYREFVKNVRFAIVHRPGIDKKEFEHLLRKINNQSLELRYDFIDMQLSNQSSSKIRQKIKNNYDDGSINSGVADYIKQNSLYRH